MKFRITAVDGARTARYEVIWLKPKIYPEQLTSLLGMAQDKAEREEGFARATTWWAFAVEVVAPAL